MALTPRKISVISNTISPVRLGTYLAARGFSAGATALEIYVWNAIVAGAFLSSLHICEVVMRNGIASALACKYGSDWPWNASFERTLPTVRKLDLQQARHGIPVGASGKVIAELKFSFWCKMLTVRHDAHVWNPYLRVAFPRIPFPLTIAAARTMLFDDMEALRGLRNRIAHHEPIFNCPLFQHQQTIARLIKWRCGETAQWLAQWEVVSAALSARP